MLIPAAIKVSFVRVVWCTAICAASSQTFSQPVATSDRELYKPGFGAEFHFGFVAPHRDIMKHLVRGHAYGFSLYKEIQTRGSVPAWHMHYARPSTGIELAFYDLGNPVQLGYGIVPLYYVRLLLNVPRDFNTSGAVRSDTKLPQPRLRHELRLGIGPGFLTKVYDMETNPKNFASASAVNAGLMLHYSVGVKLTNHLRLHAGLRAAHWSNGSFKMPNLGINLVTLNTGFTWHPRGVPDVQRRYRAQEARYWLNTSTLSVGIKEIFPPGGNKYLTYTLNHHLERDISNKVRLGVCADLFYITANRVLMARAGMSEVSTTDMVQAGLAATWGLKFGLFDVNFMMGAYVRDRYKGNGDIYSRYGIRRQFGKANGRKWVTSLMLKTHAAKADHFEIGIGYRW